MTTAETPPAPSEPGPPGEDPRDAILDDLVPLLLAAIPLAIIVVTLGVFGQPAVFNAILNQGNVLALFLALVPLFLPLLAAVTTFAVTKKWTRWSPETVARSALSAFILCLVFTPLPFVALQVALWLLIRAAVKVGSAGPRVALVTSGVALVVSGLLAGTARWDSGTDEGADFIPRLLVGRALNGLERVNLAGDKRSVLIVSRGDTYTTVITRGYPPKVERVKTESIDTGVPCELKPDPWQLTPYEVVSHLFVERYYERGTARCL